MMFIANLNVVKVFLIIEQIHANPLNEILRSMSFRKHDTFLSNLYLLHENRTMVDRLGAQGSGMYGS